MQNIIAVIWDFDKTLIPGYMQSPIFKDYGINEADFWNEVNAMPEKYKEIGIKVNPDTAYLIQFARYAKDGRFKGLGNSKLREYGTHQSFYPGIPDFIKYTKEMLKDDPDCKEYNIRVEHYIVSTGFAEIIRGSSIADYVDGIWGCEMIEGKGIDGVDVISEIAYVIDNTTKTRAIFEINKGINKNSNPEITVNTKMTDEQRRVDFRNMIYIADGPSDVPVFSLLNRFGGSTFAIYPKGSQKAFKQVKSLCEEGRVNMFAEADYSKDTTAYMWIVEKIMECVERIKQAEANKRVVSNAGPKHIVD